MTLSITMIDWFIDKIGRISRNIFHWTWRVQIQRKYFKNKNKEK
jgi:hypothetical protein